MGSYGQLSYTCVDDLNFRVYTDEEIRKISVLQITNDQSLNELGHLTPDGLYDLRMGPVSSRERDVCQTCSQGGGFCSGHCGHIELPVPVYNPFFYDVLSFITRRICWYCNRVQVSAPYKMLLSYQMRLIHHGYGQEALQMEEIASRIISNDGGTAEEVRVNIHGRDVKGSEKGFVSMAVAAALENELGAFYKKTIKGETCSPDTSTCNIRSVHATVLRYFKAQMHREMNCIFCRKRLLKFSLVNSRFMITNVVPLNLQKAKKESEKAEKNKKKPSKDISSSEDENSEEEEDSTDFDNMEAKEAKKKQKKKKKVKEPEVDEKKDTESENEETKAEEDSIYYKIVINQQTYVTPEQVRTVLRKAWDEDSELLKVLYPGLTKSTLTYPTDMFFLQTLLVVPPKFRPLNYQGGMTIEHEISAALKGVLKLSKCLTFLMSIVKGTIEEVPETLRYIISEVRGDTPLEKSQHVWFQLQGNIDCIYDSNLNPTVSVTKKGIKQLIETKQGLFRQNLMGKRVNYSARSVGAPDPLLAVDEVGVPMDFAIKLSYPVPVTQWNVEEMRQLVINGPNEYPGAVMVEDEEGKRKRLHTLDKAQRLAIANQLLTPKESHVRKVNATKIVYRHLMNGDFVLMNRQPTLHRPSIQAHRARVMPNDRVLRMPYANCKAYNADFDGDELNMHFPQNELARSESQHLITTKNQYLTPKDGSPLAGLIQDSVVSSVMLTMRGTFFSKEDYQQLLFSALSDETRKIEVLPPTIIKPKMLWSGKQVISSLLHNIIPKNKARPSFNFKTSVKVDLWQKCEPKEWTAGGSKLEKKESMTESEFVMRDGELICGVIDKSAIGSTSHGLVHTCYDLYGGTVAAKVLTAINRVCVYYLQWAGHTISVREFVTPGHVNKKRISSLAALIARTPQGVSEKLNITEEKFADYFEEAHMSGNEKEMAAIDAAYTSVLGPTTSEVAVENEKGLFRCTLDNHMRMMVDTGAKGSKVNMMQLASLFGSVAIDGKRMPMSITGKFLPSFKPYEANPRAGGYIARRFMTGMDPQAYFYLCIVGRDSLQHTAVKTANSGYLQRCLIKHLEGIQVKYDMTVRNSDGLVLQFNYGEDGLDVTKVPFLKDISTMDSLTKNYSRLLDDRSVSIAKSVGDKEEVDYHLKKLKSWQRKFGSATKTRRSGFLKFCKKRGNDIGEEGFFKETGRPNAAVALQDMWWSLPEEDKVKYKKVGSKCPDPVNSVFSGSANLGVISEALEELIDKYYSDCYSKKPRYEQTLSQEEVATTIHMKSLTSMVDPGEAVGALCAQAIGEPLTQMTLNTFHFAGRDELNVTLGVPRMIEILRNASKKISTPIMEIPFHAHITKAQANALRVMLTEVPLENVLHKLGVRSKLEYDDKSRLHRRTSVKFTFLPHSQYRRVYAIGPSEVLHYMEKWFIVRVLLKEIEKSFGRSNTLVTADMEERKRRRGKKDEDEENEAEAAMAEQDDTEYRADSPDSSDDEDEPEADVEDGTLATHIKKGKEGDDYDDVEDDNEMDDEEKKDKDDISEDEGIEEDGANSEKEEEVTFIGAPKPKKKSSAISKQEVLKRKKGLLEKSSWIVDYDFDKKEEEWCEVTFMLPVSGGSYDIPSIVRQKAKTNRVHVVPGIGRAFVVEDKDSLLLRTEGINVHKMFEYEHLLDVNRLYTNNIHMVAEMYGIEAAQRSIIRELRAVQSAYDIKVDFRHLTLLADYFTCEGVYKACSRLALSTCVSPMQKMSYETCLKFLKTAVLEAESDKMNSPSANIALGQPIKVGTNVMHVLPVIKL